MQPLADVAVLDLTQSIAGPVCTQMLATMGADVVKVEPPGGDTFRGVVDGAMFASFNLSGKRSVCVDLRTAEGREVVGQLAAEADVVAESFRPGTLAKFGLDYDSVSQTNGEVVYLSITGFGQEGPYSSYPAYDPVVQAASGLMSVIGYPDRRPCRVGASVTDCATGTNAAFMVLSALMERGRTGEGTHIDLSLFDTAISWMAYWIAAYSGTGDVPRRAGSGFAGLSPNDVFEVGTGDMVYLCTVNDAQWERVCAAVGREDLLEEDKFETNALRWEHREALREELESTFEDYDRAGLVEALTSAGVPAGPVQSVDEVVDEDPHVRARRMLTGTHNLVSDRDIETGRLPMRTADWVPDFDGDPPSCGEHTREVLGELGYDAGSIESLLSDEVVFEA